MLQAMQNNEFDFRFISVSFWESIQLGGVLKNGVDTIYNRICMTHQWTSVINTYGNVNRTQAQRDIKKINPRPTRDMLIDI